MKLNKQEQQLITIQLLCNEMGCKPSFIYEHFFKITDTSALTEKGVSNLIYWLRDRKQIIYQILIYALELGLIKSTAYDTINENLEKMEPVVEKMGYKCVFGWMDLQELHSVFIKLKRMLVYTLQNFEYKVPEELVSSDLSNLNPTEMKAITPEQLKCLNTLISKLHVSKEDKATMVHGFSGGRVTSSKDLSSSEALEMIKYLKSFDPSERMRKKVFALAYEAGIIYGDTPDDKKMNAAKLNLFLLERGTVRKELNKMTSAELVKVVSQFEQIVKHSKQTSANKVAKSLLDELNLSVTKTRQKSR